MGRGRGVLVVALIGQCQFPTASTTLASHQPLRVGPSCLIELTPQRLRWLSTAACVLVLACLLARLLVCCVHACMHVCVRCVVQWTSHEESILLHLVCLFSLAPLCS